MVADMAARPLIATLVCLACVVCSRPPTRQPAGADHAIANLKPEAAVEAIIRLFDDHTVVGLSDLHGCAELMGFVGQLVRDSAFLDAVNDITWEPGNVRYQRLMDEFILGGADLSRQELSACWRN